MAKPDTQAGGMAGLQIIHRTTNVTTKDNPHTNVESRYKSTAETQNKRVTTTRLEFISVT
jgi:type VI protein secretion system component VasA